jgi:hypothetical protein
MLLVNYTSNNKKDPRLSGPCLYQKRFLRIYYKMPTVLGEFRPKPIPEIIFFCTIFIGVNLP